MLTAQDILRAQDLKVQQVECPEWGGTVYVREMTAAEATRIQGLATEESVTFTPETMATVVGLTLCDAQGQRLFQDEAVVELQQKNNKVITRLFFAAMTVAGLSREGIDEAGKD